MAESLTVELGRPISAEWVRKRLFLAREKFTHFLLNEVALSLEDPSHDAIEQELLALGLHVYCQPALRRRRTGG
jgi:hypothetical protein